MSAPAAVVATVWPDVVGGYAAHVAAWPSPRAAGWRGSELPGAS